MPRLARIVVPDLPHHVTQRGNRRQRVFFGDDDDAAYRAPLGEHRRSAGVAVRAWCLMPNQVHLMLVPPDAGALRVALAETHRRYSRLVNFREGWRGDLRQGRFASCPLDEAHRRTAARDIELNPVRARLVDRPEAWSWSSAAAHLTGRPDGLTEVAALGVPVAEWSAFLARGLGEDEAAALRAGERTGRPLGDERFVAALETRTGRALARRAPGPKPRVVQHSVTRSRGTGVAAE